VKRSTTKSDGICSVSLLWQPGFEGLTWHNFYLKEWPEGGNPRAQAFVDLPGAYRALPCSHRARRAQMAIGVPDGILSVMSATPRQIVPHNLVQGRIDHDPSVPGGQLGGGQDVGTLDDVRWWQRDGLLDQMPTEGLPLGHAAVDQSPW
jgi:hypothetical protein